MEVHWRLHLVGVAIGVEREQVRGVGPAGQAVGLHADGGHEVKPEEGEVGEVVLRERLVLQVGMDAADPAKMPSPKRVVGEHRYHDLAFGADYDGDDRALAVNDDAYLASGLP